jgi:hypothetical protein
VLNLGGYDLLMKPFTALEVSRVVQMAARNQAASEAQAFTEEVKPGGKVAGA